MVCGMVPPLSGIARRSPWGHLLFRVRPSARCRDLHRRHGLTIKSCPSALRHSSPVPSRVPVLHAVVRRLTREFDTADLRSVSDRFPQSLRNCNCTRENSGIQGRSQLGGGVDRGIRASATQHADQPVRFSEIRRETSEIG